MALYPLSQRTPSWDVPWETRGTAAQIVREKCGTVVGRHILAGSLRSLAARWGADDLRSSHSWLRQAGVLLGLLGFLFAFGGSAAAGGLPPHLKIVRQVSGGNVLIEEDWSIGEIRRTDLHYEAHRCIAAPTNVVVVEPIEDDLGRDISLGNLYVPNCLGSAGKERRRRGRGERLGSKTPQH
jgi:hypothetical protein